MTRDLHSDPTSQASIKDREEQFHDQWASGTAPRDVMVDASWSAATCPEHRWIKDRLGDPRGKRVLDVGCGCGEAAVWFAKRGASVVATDLSREFLDLVRRVAALHGVSLETVPGDAGVLAFPDDTFDVVYAGNLLHHVDLEQTLLEIKRVLKPGGRVVTWDPLRHNPVINLYRRMASKVRTPDEHPLHIREVEVFRRHFTGVEYECFWLFTLWLFARFYLIERVHPSSDRYWKKIVREHERLAPKYSRLEKIDRAVLKAIPFLKRYCWNIAVVAKKPIPGPPA